MYAENVKEGCPNLKNFWSYFKTGIEEQEGSSHKIRKLDRLLSKL